MLTEIYSQCSQPTEPMEKVRARRFHKDGFIPLKGTDPKQRGDISSQTE